MDGFSETHFVVVTSTFILERLEFQRNSILMREFIIRRDRDMFSLIGEVVIDWRAEREFQMERNFSEV